MKNTADRSNVLSSSAYISRVRQSQNRISIIQAGAVTHVAPQSGVIAVPFLSEIFAVFCFIIDLFSCMVIISRRPSPHFYHGSLTISFVWYTVASVFITTARHEEDSVGCHYRRLRSFHIAIATTRH